MIEALIRPSKKLIYNSVARQARIEGFDLVCYLSKFDAKDRFWETCKLIANYRVLGRLINQPQGANSEQ